MPFEMHTTKLSQLIMLTFFSRNEAARWFHSFIHSFINTHKAAEKYKTQYTDNKKYIKTLHRSIKLRHVHTYQQNRAKTVVSQDWQIVWEIQ